VKAERRLGCDGSTSEHSVRTYRGASDTRLRSMLRPITQRERVRYAEEVYAEVSGKIETIRSTFRHVDDLNGPLEIEDEVRFKWRVDWATQSRYDSTDPWFDEVAKTGENRNQHHPFAIGGVEVETETVFEICDRYVVDSVGPSLDFQDRFGALTRSYERTEKGVVVRTRFAMPEANIPVADLPRLRRLIEIFRENGSISFEFKPR
jgi:hypothetical protein